MDDTIRNELLLRCDRSMYVIVTDAHIAAGMSRNGAWSREQFSCIGVDWPPVGGWKGRVIGQRLPGSVVAAFIRLRDAHLPLKTPSLFDGTEGN